MNSVTSPPAQVAKRRLMRVSLQVAAGFAASGLIGAWGMRLLDERSARQAWAELAGLGGGNAMPFTSAIIEGLPEPAQRYFTYAIAPGTPIRTVVELTMEGEIGLGDRQEPNYQPMRAQEILAPPHGFVWIPQIGSQDQMAALTIRLGRASGCLGRSR